MKRNITLLVLLLAMLMLVACGSQEPAADNNAANFEDVDGKLVALDTESKVFESPAVKVTIDKDAKTVTFGTRGRGRDHGRGLPQVRSREQPS